MFEDRETEERIAILNVSNSLNFDISPNLSVPQFIVLSKINCESLMLLQENRQYCLMRIIFVGENKLVLNS